MRSENGGGEVTAIDRVRAIFYDQPHRCEGCALLDVYPDLPDEQGGLECLIVHGGMSPSLCPALQPQPFNQKQFIELENK